MKADVRQTSVVISEASPEDAEALERLINSAYRGASALQGWTTEAQLIDGTRTDAQLIRDIIEDTTSVMLKAVNASGIVGCVELRMEEDRLYLGTRSEERRVGKECRWRCAPYRYGDRRW